MRTIGIAVIVVALVAAFTGIVSADPDGAGVSAGDTSTWAATTAGDDAAAGGDITALDLTIDQGTIKWQGYWGNITDMIVLADASGNKMYDWGSATTLTGEVFATTADGVPAWTSVNSVTATERDNATTGIDALWSWTASSDDAGETFTLETASVTVAGVTTASDAVATAVDAILPTGNGWQTVVITDATTIAGKDDYIFVGIINEDRTGYDTTTVDYQMIVPGEATYYFYVEVG